MNKDRSLNILSRKQFSIRFGFTQIRTFSAAALITFWLTVVLSQYGLELPVIRPIAGVAVSVLAPGLITVYVFDVEPKTLGEHLFFSLGLGLSVFGVLTVLVGFFSSVAATDILPLEAIFGILLTVLICSSLIILYTRESTTKKINDNHTSLQYSINVTGPILIPGIAVCLPVLSILAAILMDTTGNNTLMYVLTTGITAVVVIGSTELLHRNQYSIFVFFVSVATLLHRNLITPHVLGADIQLLYYVSNLTAESGFWLPEISGPLSGLPIVTSVPAALSIIAGIDLAPVFKIMFTLSFAFVPLGIYHIYSHLFEEEIGLYAALFFLFYHITFYFTPGKQLMSEIFVVLILLMIFKYDVDSLGTKVALGVLSFGLIQSHYAMTAVFGFALLFTSIVMFFSRSYRPGDSPVSIRYPVLLIVASAGWYTFASRELIEKLIAAPQALAIRALVLVTGKSSEVGGSGASFVSQHTASTVSQQKILLEFGTLLIYFLFSVLLTIGLFYKLVEILLDPTEEDETNIFSSVLAVPLFVFLGISYFVHLNLWADRVYQMVLIVLAPFIPIGYLKVRFAFGKLREQLSLPTIDPVLPSKWSLLACCAALLFTLNSGLAFAIAGVPTDPTFSSDVRSAAFNENEIDAAKWVKRDADVERIDYRRVFVIPRTTNRTFPNDVVVYTDGYTYQLFRSVAPANYYNMRYAQVPANITLEGIQDGYIVIPKDRLATADSEGTTALISKKELAMLRENGGEMAYKNEDVVVFRIKNT